MMNTLKNSKKTSTDSPLSLDGIPGLGPVAMKALKAEGYETSLQLSCKTPTFLKEVTGMDKVKAGEAFAFMKQRLIDAGHLPKGKMLASELLLERMKIQRIRIGCPTLDRLLNGGIECKSITEFYGENGSGKTQISHQLAVMVQRPISEGGLLEDPKNPPLVLYIDTEKTCRPERMVGIMAGLKLITDYPAALRDKIIDNKVLNKEEVALKAEVLEKQKKESKPYLDKIIVQQATNAAGQFMLIQNAMQLCGVANIKLIIVDSGTALFRSEYLGRGNTKAKFDLMNEMIHDLKNIASNYNIAVVFVNQIYHSPEQSFGKDEDIPYGGNIIGHAIPYRIKLEKFTKSHKMTIKKSPYQANDEQKFAVTEAGVVDLK